MQRIIDNEIGSLKWGIYNLGFLGVRNGPVGSDFADWWAERLRHFCFDRLEAGLFTDQKWINHVPVLLRRRRHPQGAPLQRRHLEHHHARR